MTALVSSKTETLDPMLSRPYAMRSIWMESADTFTFEIEPADGGEAMSFLPGQFTMLYVYGIGEVPISISGDTRRTDILTQTVRSVGAVTEALSKLRPGSMVGVRGPFGKPWPHKLIEGKDVVIVAGGIGLPPLRPLIYQIAASRINYGRVVILYGARTPHDLMFQNVPFKHDSTESSVLYGARPGECAGFNQLNYWNEHSGMQVEVTVDTAESGWLGNVGVVTKLIPRAEFDVQHAVAVMCGPEIMMRFTIKALQERGIKSDQIYVSMERNMKCGIGLCGHCQLGPYFVCKDGPVFRLDEIASLFEMREV